MFWKSDWTTLQWVDAPEWVRKAASKRVNGGRKTKFILRGKTFEYRVTPRKTWVKWPTWTVGKIERRLRGSRPRRRGFPFRKALLAIVVLAAVLGGVFALGDRYRNTVLEYLEGFSSESTALILPATSTPEPSASRSLTPTPVPRANLRHMDEKLYMLELINAERVKAGVPPVVLGDNIAAQVHAEATLAICSGSHWGSDGLKPYMRYSLAGGYQSNAENGTGGSCITSETRSPSGFQYARLGPILTEIEIDSWMDSEPHRDNILNKHHKKVNIGMAWDEYTLMVFQHFEGDYVEYNQLPSFDGEELHLSGRVKEEVSLSKEGFGVHISYDEPPHALTRGQLSRTYCYSYGRPVAGLRPPLSGGSFYDSHEYTTLHSPCPNPYDVPADAPGPQSPDQDEQFFQEAYNKSQNPVGKSVTVLWITAKEWRVGSESFTVRANVEDVLSQFGKGVYTIMVWGTIDGEDAVISEYSIFHGVTPPDTYTSSTGK